MAFFESEKSEEWLLRQAGHSKIVQCPAALNEIEGRGGYKGVDSGFQVCVNADE